MKISFNWLKTYIDLTGFTADDLTQLLPMIGHEVESVESFGLAPTPHLVVGEVLAREPHPKSDRLGVCQVRVAPGGDPVQIVCGASNYAVGDRVPVALAGCRLPGDVVIGQTSLRGVESNGMMCSAKELGLGKDHAGLMILTSRPEVGTPVNQIVPELDTIIELKLTANRGDCMSHIGIARELAAVWGRSLCLPHIESKPSGIVDPASTGVLHGVEVTSPDCSLYLGWVISGVRVTESPAWLKTAVESVGLRSINNVVDITNFVMLESGQPLHAFDASRIAGRRLFIRPARDGETLVTLDGQVRSLTAGMLVIADTERPLVIAGVMGSKAAEVDASTVDLVLESASFSPGAIRATSRALGLFTDSSHRFTRDVDPCGAECWGRRAVDLILKVAGGSAVPVPFRYGTPNRGENVIPVSGSWIREKLGFDASDAEIQQVFQRLGFKVDHSSPQWKVTVPSPRAEVSRPIDLVEEFIRIHGTAKVPAQPVNSPGLFRQDDPKAVFTSRAVDFLVQQGFSECVHYSLVDERQIARGYRADAAPDLILDNPLNAEMSHVRASLLPGLIDCMRLNTTRGTTPWKLCEAGHVFRVADGQIHELLSIAFLFHAENPSRSWKTSETADFFSAKALMEHLADLAGIPASDRDYRADRAHPIFQAGHGATAGCYHENGWMLFTGMLDLRHLFSIDLKSRILAGEILVKPSWLQKQSRLQTRFQSFSDQPSSIKDLALLVPEMLPAETVRRQLEAICHQEAGTSFRAESVVLFDRYTDARLAAQQQQSLAFSITFRAPDRTLTDREINSALERIQTALRKLGYSLRQ